MVVGGEVGKCILGVGLNVVMRLGGLRRAVGGV